MARTYRKEAFNYYQKEKKAQRKNHYKAYRKNTNRKVRDGEEVIEDVRRTGGWLTH